MSLVSESGGQTKSHVTTLPIIDLHATDMTALYSLLRYVENQCSNLNKIPCITFDQQLYVKAMEIAEAKNINAFIRLGGFHQLMSFLGSIGTLMDGSGLRKALETVYAPVTVSHMFTGKAYSRSIRGHMLSASSLVAILLEPYWKALSEEDQEAIMEFYESHDPDSHQNHKVATALVSSLEDKSNELSSNSRTAALWISYVKYVSIAQLFIDAERTSDWLLHLDATKMMLNLFAATGHNNYAKSCRLYLQSAAEMEEKNPTIYQQFLSGQHTIRRTSRGWSGLWTDLSIEQILMKSLKGRSGIIGRGITENVMLVWTKSMHR